VGVCANAFNSKSTQVILNQIERCIAEEKCRVIVKDVLAEPGHIACDSMTESEIVVPLTIRGITIGVLDLDCERKFFETLETLVYDFLCE